MVMTSKGVDSFASTRVERTDFLITDGMTSGASGELPFGEAGGSVGGGRHFRAMKRE